MKLNELIKQLEECRESLGGDVDARVWLNPSSYLLGEVRIVSYSDGERMIHIEALQPSQWKNGLKL